MYAYYKRLELFIPTKLYKIWAIKWSATENPPMNASKSQIAVSFLKYVILLVSSSTVNEQRSIPDPVIVVYDLFIEF